MCVCIYIDKDGTTRIVSQLVLPASSKQEIGSQEPGRWKK